MATDIAKFCGTRGPIMTPEGSVPEDLSHMQNRKLAASHILMNNVSGSS